MPGGSARSSACAALAAAAAALLSMSCKGDECSTDRDCRSGYTCFRGSCTPLGDTGSPDSDDDAHDATTETDGPGEGEAGCTADEQCDDGQVCSVDHCDLETGECRFSPRPDHESCDNGLSCDGPDECIADECLSGPEPCPPADTPCMYHACDEVTGECPLVPILDGALCGTYDPCTGGGTCQGGACEPLEIEAPCDDHNACTVDSCTPDGPDPSCSHEPVETGTTCSDDDACGGTAGRTCVAGGCAAGTDAPCSDGSLCVTTSCTGGACTIDTPPDPPTPLPCGGTAGGSTLAGANDVSAYGAACGDGLTGGERVFAVELPGGTVHLDLRLTDVVSTGPLSVMLLDDPCDPTSCTATSGAEATVSSPVLGGRVYHAVVDGAANARGTFTIAAECR